MTDFDRGMLRKPNCFFLIVFTVILTFNYLVFSTPVSTSRSLFKRVGTGNGNGNGNIGDNYGVNMQGNNLDNYNNNPSGLLAAQAKGYYIPASSPTTEYYVPASSPATEYYVQESTPTTIESSTPYPTVTILPNKPKSKGKKKSTKKGKKKPKKPKKKVKSTKKTEEVVTTSIPDEILDESEAKTEDDEGIFFTILPNKLRGFFSSFKPSFCKLKLSSDSQVERIMSKILDSFLDKKIDERLQKYLLQTSVTKTEKLKNDELELTLNDQQQVPEMETSGDNANGYPYAAFSEEASSLEPTTLANFQRSEAVGATGCEPFEVYFNQYLGIFGLDPPNQKKQLEPHFTTISTFFGEKISHLTFIWPNFRSVTYGGRRLTDQYVWTKDFTFEPGEKVLSLNVDYDEKRVHGIMFRTTFGRASGNTGVLDRDRKTFRAPKGHEIVGLYGGATDHICSLGIIYSRFMIKKVD
ncbi:hypothetical protein G9A89_018280 [Geosiphon pyriformis]|nr:hypothetical protein G9A89_018280 [Geosiphon pyriformis]